MGYAAARGGLEAIEAAERLVRDERELGPSPWLSTDQLIDRQRLLVDRVMGEGGLWEPQLAARALQQAEGDPIEAAHLVRSHRATLPRLANSEPIDVDEGRILRRIVPAYRRPPGPQLLGRTTDYTGRRLDTTADELVRERAEKRQAARDEPLPDDVSTPATDAADGTAGGGPHPRLLQVLRDLDLVVDRRRSDDPDPVDITRQAVRPPAPRSARLAVMARAETGALVNLWYRNILGPDGYLHEVTLGEVRHAELPVSIEHPQLGVPVTIGSVRVTEVEAIEDLDGAGEERTKFDVGYGMCLGHNEKKAIAMANLDIACDRAAAAGHGAELEQSVLMTTDGLDASGFLEHLKLPHYVTFRSMIDRKMAVRASLGDPPTDESAALTSTGPDGSDCA